MPYQVKNKFLILGLTGPLGSGCSTTAKFLSGMPFDSQVTIKELLQLQVSTLKDLDEKISNEYQTIYRIKKGIKDRLDKRLGPYKRNWIDPNSDERVETYSQEINKHHSKLKIYLRKREVYHSLQDFLGSNNFSKENLNEDDQKVFGLTPFCSISYTTSIVKLALEQYLKDGNKIIDRYFLKKMNETKNGEEKDAFRLLKRYIKTNLKVSDEKKKAYLSSNIYMKKRVYQFSLHTDILKDDSIKEKLNEEMSKFFKSFYDYILTVNKFLKKLKLYADKKGKIFTDSLSDILQDWGDNIRTTGFPFIFSEDIPGINPYDNLFVLSNEINILIKALRFRIRN